MEWIAFERVSGPLLITERIDYAATFIAYVMALSQGAKVGGRTVRFKDFRIDWDRKPMTDEQMAMELGKAMEAAVSQPSPHS